MTLQANPSALKWVDVVVITAIVLTYGLATYQRNFVWKDDLSLWSYILA